MTIAFIFPGQGSQKIGMGKDLYDTFAEARAVFQEVDEALKQNLSKLIFSGDEDELTLTENAQPALMATSLAVVRVLEQQGNPISEMGTAVAGHSLGEYSALSAIGTFSLSDTAKLLKLRGQAMQKATPKGVGAMAAILGLSIDEVRDITTKSVDEISSRDGKNYVCSAANDNADGQVVISGHREAVEYASEQALNKGAKKSVMLPVSAPFHCALMQSASDKMAEALDNVQMHPPALPLIANVTADSVKDVAVIKDLLVQQVCAPVRWRESVLKMRDLGISNLIECGAGKVLSGLTRRIDRDLSPQSINSPQDIEDFLKQF